MTHGDAHYHDPVSPILEGDQDQTLRLSYLLDESPRG
jgi:hypothetical protein